MEASPQAVHADEVARNPPFVYDSPPMPVEPVIPDPAPPVSKATLIGVAIFVVALVVLLFLIPDAEPKIAPEVTDMSKIYAESCAACHGPQGMGKLSFPKIVGTAKTEEEIVQLLENGKGKMPPVNGWTPEQKAAMAKFVKGMPETK